jgi:hypothetical protein
VSFIYIVSVLFHFASESTKSIIGISNNFFSSLNCIKLIILMFVIEHAASWTASVV